MCCIILQNPFAAAQVNEIVNKDLNVEFSRYNNLPFSAPWQVVFTRLLLNKEMEMDDAGNRHVMAC